MEYCNPFNAATQAKLSTSFAEFVSKTHARAANAPEQVHRESAFPKETAISGEPRVSSRSHAAALPLSNLCHFLITVADKRFLISLGRLPPSVLPSDSYASASFFFLRIHREEAQQQQQQQPQQQLSTGAKTATTGPSSSTGGHPAPGRSQSARLHARALRRGRYKSRLLRPTEARKPLQLRQRLGVSSHYCRRDSEALGLPRGGTGSAFACRARGTCSARPGCSLAVRIKSPPAYKITRGGVPGMGQVLQRYNNSS